MGAAQSTPSNQYSVTGTVIGWTVIAAIVGYFIYTRTNENRQREANKIAAQKKSEGRGIQPKDNKDKAKKQRQDTFVAEAKKAQKKPKPAPVQQSKPADADASSDDDGLANKEFARQLSQAKEGLKFAPKSANEQKQKLVKQSKAQEIDSTPHEEKVSAPSSTGGIDADDDQSISTSPLAVATEAGDVSDMLEKPAPGPNVLRLTDTEEKKKAARPAKAPQPVETKKQRQNRRKAEEKKAAREEDEKERKVLMEKQRRLARESEGRPAKDGSAFTAAQAKASVWTGNGVNGKSQDVDKAKDEPFLPVQPLDTTENTASKKEEAAAPAPKPDVPASPATSSTNGKSDNWLPTYLSEEEQMAMIKDQEEWSTVVPKSRKGKKKAAATETNSETASETLADNTNQPAADRKQPSSSPNGPTKTFGHQSSFAALGFDGTADDEEEVVEEWDV